ncbi:deoxyhypusine hydroxylase [Entomophthora muscae]|uniref:Deoxyhypusine hydroxylase n=1 Tax=Entomophthora muscae TaxID=34485 RepID=A0ACC2RMT9_9FUNG|nr:deoxyhypusine hydroxylase [Entomophthora muscae]
MTQDSVFPHPNLEELERVLLGISSNEKPVPLAERFRALFSLKALKTEQAVHIVAKAFRDDSALLKHEVAYVLGQMKNPAALPCLETVLRKLDEDPMVRHEAAEAMGAIGDKSSLPILTEFLQDDSPDVSQTCELAIEKIEFDSNEAASGVKNSIYQSIDPAPPAFEDLPVAELKKILLDETLPLFKRYRAMFGLRNKNTSESVLALAEGLDDSSALFRHEIAFIFGQMQHPASVPALIKSLSKEGEAAMVRHESAEALGSIATPEVLEVLKKFSKDPEQVVRESCIVALDMYEYENSDQFQYAHVV